MAGYTVKKAKAEAEAIVQRCRGAVGRRVTQWETREKAKAGGRRQVKAIDDKVHNVHKCP